MYGVDTSGGTALLDDQQGSSRRARPGAHAVAARRECTITVVVPTVDEAATIERVAGELVGLRRAGAIDRVVVFDDSVDGTPFLAEAAGAEVIRQGDVCSEFGSVMGKGDAMWRSLAVCDTEVVGFVDGDTRDFSASMALDLVAAVALGGDAFAKATYRRPWLAGGVTLPTGGGRVTELTAKPLLRAFAPALRAFDQPLAGEIAARTELLREVPFATGYGVDVALLIDVWRTVGIERMTQVDTGVRQNRHRPLEQLGPMAEAVAGAILHRTGHATSSVPPLVDRPPMASLVVGEVA